MEQKLKQQDNIRELLGMESEGEDSFESFLTRRSEEWRNKPASELTEIATVNATNPNVDDAVAHSSEATASGTDAEETTNKLSSALVAGVKDEDVAGMPTVFDGKESKIEIRGVPGYQYVTEVIDDTFATDEGRKKSYMNGFSTPITKLTIEQTQLRIHNAQRLMKLLGDNVQGMRRGIEEVLKGMNEEQRAKVLENDKALEKEFKTKYRTVKTKADGSSPTKSAPKPSKTEIEHGLNVKDKKMVDGLKANYFDKAACIKTVTDLKKNTEPILRYIEKVFG